MSKFILLAEGVSVYAAEWQLLIRHHKVPMHHGSCDQQSNCNQACPRRGAVLTSKAAPRMGRRTQPRGPPWSGCPRTTPDGKRTRWQPRHGQVLSPCHCMLHIIIETRAGWQHAGSTWIHLTTPVKPARCMVCQAYLWATLATSVAEHACRCTAAAAAGCCCRHRCTCAGAGNPC